MEQLIIKKGSIYVDANLYDTYFSEVEAVVLLKANDGVLLMPVQNASGGLLLKIRNAAGDRVVHASEFFMFNEIECDSEQIVNAFWSTERAALVLNMG